MATKAERSSPRLRCEGTTCVPDTRPVALLRLRPLDVDHRLTTAHPNHDRLSRFFGRRSLTVDGATRHVREVAGPHRDLLVASRPEFDFNRTTKNVKVGIGLAVVVPAAPDARLRPDMPDPPILIGESHLTHHARCGRPGGQDAIRLAYHSGSHGTHLALPLPLARVTLRSRPGMRNEVRTVGQELHERVHPARHADRLPNLKSPRRRTSVNTVGQNGRACLSPPATPTLPGTELPIRHRSSAGCPPGPSCYAQSSNVGRMIQRPLPRSLA
jgi:hypothetical protein